MQVAAAGEIALVDGVRIADLSPLGAVLAAPGVRKVVHSGSGDVPILRRVTGVAPQPLFDTQIAAGFAGLGGGISYAALVRELFAVELPKHETRTDWTRRPLAPEQLRYAAEDVEHLVAAALELERRLVELGRLEWALEDSAEVAELPPESGDPANAYRRVKGLDRLAPHERSVARALAAWREREADRLDLARSFLLRDETLVALARREPLARDEAAKLPGYDGRRHAAHVGAWIAALESSRAEAAASGAVVDPPRPSREERDRRRALDDAIAELVSRRAGELGLAPELLLSRRRRDAALAVWEEMREAERGVPLSAALGGFRGRLFGADLDSIGERFARP